jgi:hypothetical protein
VLPDPSVGAASEGLDAFVLNLETAVVVLVGVIEEGEIFIMT